MIRRHGGCQSYLTSPLLPTRRYDVADFEKPKSPQHKSSFSRTLKRTFLPGSLLVSFSLPTFVDPSPIPSFVPLCPIVAAGVARIYPRRGESHPLSLLSQARAREYVVAPFSSTLWCPPRSGYPWSSNLLPRAARGNARCIRMFLQLTRTLYVLITAERALKERHHLWPPCKWATPRQIVCVSCQRWSLSSLQLPARKYLFSGLFYMYRIGEFERRNCTI